MEEIPVSKSYVNLEGEKILYKEYVNLIDNESVIIYELNSSNSYVLSQQKKFITFTKGNTDELISVLVLNKIHNGYTKKWLKKLGLNENYTTINAKDKYAYTFVSKYDNLGIEITLVNGELENSVDTYKKVDPYQEELFNQF